MTFLTLGITADFPDLPDAECAKTPDVAEFFFATDTDYSTTKAVAICRRCPEIRACLAWALTHNEMGVWAGTTETQRSDLRAQLRSRRTA